MNSWRDFWTANPARVRFFHFVVVPLAIVPLFAVFIAINVLEVGVQALWMLCVGIVSDARHIATQWANDYRKAIAKAKGGMR